MKIETKAAKQFGKRVLALRRAIGWSQERLAAEAGISANYLGEIERAECNVSLGHVARIAFALGLPIERLFGKMKS